MESVISPEKFPVIVNAMFTERSATSVVDRLYVNPAIRVSSRARVFSKVRARSNAWFVPEVAAPVMSSVSSLVLVDQLSRSPSHDPRQTLVDGVLGLVLAPGAGHCFAPLEDWQSSRQ